MEEKKKLKYRPFWKRSRLVHRYYRLHGFYTFLTKVLHKALLPFALVVVAIFLFDFFILDLNPIFDDVVHAVPDFVVLILFTLSETFFGVIPPEVFMLWAGEKIPFFLYISLLAFLSYFAGILAYFIGVYITSLPRVMNYLENKISKYVGFLRSWGAIMIIAGAILPIPYASVSMAAGLIKYPLNNYLAYGLIRIIRYYAYGYLLFYMV